MMDYIDESEQIDFKTLAAISTAAAVDLVLLWVKELGK